VRRSRWPVRFSDSLCRSLKPNASIAGTATSRTGEVLPNLNVQLRDLSTGQVVQTKTTNEKGDCVFLDLPPGNFAVEAVNASGQVIGISASISVAAGQAVTGGNSAISKIFIAFVLALATTWCTAPVYAQTQPQTEDGGPDPSQMRVRMGPFWLNPRVILTNLGFDTNVFNAPDQNNVPGQLGPQKDFTFTVTPTTDVWLRMGVSWLQMTIREDLVWYQEFETERGANTFLDVAWRAPIGRTLVSISPRYLSTNERPGYEIDARVRRREYGVSGKVEVRAFARTFFGLTGSTNNVKYDDDAVFYGRNLQHDLNRRTTSYGLVARQEVTPLTSLSVDASRQEDRFEFNPLRDANSTAVNGSVSFDPHALIRGSASFGYREFIPLSNDLPPYRGPIGAVDLSYTLLGVTRFAVQWKRDVNFSFDETQPYYLETGFTGTVTQQIFGPFDAQVRGGVQHLAYRNRLGVPLNENRTDDVTTYGGGIGYHFGQDARFGVNVEHQSRTSPVPAREFSALRYGISVTYGF
jgi:Putative beta-barrel porin 2/Carboxypeptidase regulatory-like domain